MTGEQKNQKKKKIKNKNKNITQIRKKFSLCAVGFSLTVFFFCCPPFCFCEFFFCYSAVLFIFLVSNFSVTKEKKRKYGVFGTHIDTHATHARNTPNTPNTHTHTQIKTAKKKKKSKKKIKIKTVVSIIGYIIDCQRNKSSVAIGSVTLSALVMASAVIGWGLKENCKQLQEQWQIFGSSYTVQTEWGESLYLMTIASATALIAAVFLAFS